MGQPSLFRALAGPSRRARPQGRSGGAQPDMGRRFSWPISWPIILVVFGPSGPTSRPRCRTGARRGRRRALPVDTPRGLRGHSATTCLKLRRAGRGLASTTEQWPAKPRGSSIVWAMVNAREAVVNRNFYYVMAGLVLGVILGV